MKQYLFFILLLTIFSCRETNKRNIIQGDIYIKLIDVHSLYGLPSQKLEEFKQKVLKSNQNNHSESEKKLNRYFKILINHDLFNKPHFKLKTKEGKIINIYTSKKEYTKLAIHLKNFDRDEEKISVKFEGNKIPNNIIDTDSIFNQSIYYAKNIISVQKNAGVTDWAK